MKFQFLTTGLSVVIHTVDNKPWADYFICRPPVNKKPEAPLDS